MLLFKSSLLVITKSLNFCNSSKYSAPAFFLTCFVKTSFKNFNLPTSTLSPAARPISFSLINFPSVDIVSLALAKGIVPLGLAKLSKISFLKTPSTLATFLKFFVSLSESLAMAFAISSVLIVLIPVTLSNSFAASFTSALYVLLKSPIIDLNSIPVTFVLPSGNLNTFLVNRFSDTSCFFIIFLIESLFLLQLFLILKL